LLILVLLAALLEGFILSINSDQELIGVDRGQTRAFYGALAGLEQLTGNLGTLFGSNYSPSVSQIDALTVDPPVIPGIQFVGPVGNRDTGSNMRWITTGAPLRRHARFHPVRMRVW
jgi:hypothetical protein